MNWYCNLFSRLSLRRLTKIWVQSRFLFFVLLFIFENGSSTSKWRKINKRWYNSERSEAKELSEKEKMNEQIPSKTCRQTQRHKHQTCMDQPICAFEIKKSTIKILRRLFVNKEANGILFWWFLIELVDYIHYYK